MKIPLYQINAFSDSRFGGNPAAVCPLSGWLDDELMQAIAGENNLSETAFIIAGSCGYQIRWFTPACEVDLCGHATLAAAAVINRYLQPGRSDIRFESRSGVLRVGVDGDLLTLDFPARPTDPVDPPPDLLEGLDVAPQEVRVSDYYLVVLAHEEEVTAVEPDFARLQRLDRIGVIITAPGREVDFVSRFFAPSAGVPEDAVTGSAHCLLTPYWAERLGKKRLTARQLSRRGGDLICEDKGDRVAISGHAVTYLQGSIEV